MKARVTKHDMKSRFDQIICIGYCDAQSLLRDQTPFAYSARAEGWACDYYSVDGVLISTGYAPLKSVNTQSNYNLVKKYEDQARAIASDYSMAHDQQAEKIEKLLQDYMKEVTQ